MKNIVKQILLSIFFVMFFFGLSYAQQKLGGEYDVTLKKSHCAEFKDSINWLYVEEPDSIPYAPDRGISKAIGFAIPINKDFFELATKQETVNEYIFMLRITQRNAFNTSISFKKFYLPEGSEINLLDTNGVVLENYDPHNSENNPELPEEALTIWNIPADVILRFICKKDKLGKSSLFLERLFYGYRDLTIISTPNENITKKITPRIKSTQSCDFSVPCFTDYTNWFNEINSVVVIDMFYLIGGTPYSISGSAVLLNTPDYYNYDDSKKPFVLTAAHLLDELRANNQNVNNILSSSSNVYLFNQKNSCGGGTGTIKMDNKGFNLIFEGQRSGVDDFANDYLLLQFRKTDISDLKNKGNVTFAGYDANLKINYDLVESVPAYCFHHPRLDGPDKKYMKLNNIINNSNGYYAYYNELGFTQAGSSGSPVFDKNHLLIGLVAAGDGNTCSNPTYQRPVGPKFSYIFSNISQYLGAECITYSYDPIYAHLPAHCRNCSLDETLGEVEVDCGGPCKPCGQWYEENVSIDNERLLANVIQSKTVTTTSGNNITLKSGKTSNIFFSESLTLNAGFSVEQGANFSLNTKSYSEPINQVCESMCLPPYIPTYICEGHSWFCRVPNTTWVTVKVYQANASRTFHAKIYEDSFPNFTNDKIILWDGITGVKTGIDWDNSRQYRIELQLQDCLGNIFSIEFNDGIFLAFTTSGCSS